MNAITKSQRRAELADMMRRRDTTPVAKLAEHYDVSERVIRKDIAVLERRFRTYHRENPGLLCERLRHLSRVAEAQGEIGDAIRAEVTIGKLTGALSQDAINVTANAQASAINTFAELSRKASQEVEAGNRLAGLS